MRNERAVRNSLKRFLPDWSKYRYYRNCASDKIKKAKATHNRRLISIEESGNDHKIFWRTMKKILLGEIKAASPSIHIEGNLSSDKGQIANTFNKFSQVPQLVQIYWSIFGLPVVAYWPSLPSGTVNIRLLNFKMFLSICSSQPRTLKAGKAVGLDTIPARLLMDSADIIAKPLINMSLRTGRVPLEWKTARVIPLFKKSRAVDMEKYRLISILPVLSKVL